MSESSSGEEDEDFQPFEDNSNEDYSSNDDAENLEEDIASLQKEGRKVAREEAKKKTIKKAIANGTFVSPLPFSFVDLHLLSNLRQEATWHDDEQDNVSEPMASSAVEEVCICVGHYLLFFNQWPCSSPTQSNSAPILTRRSMRFPLPIPYLLVLLLPLPLLLPATSSLSSPWLVAAFFRCVPSLQSSSSCLISQWSSLHGSYMGLSTFQTVALVQT